jgi:hypothetical protein
VIGLAVGHAGTAGGGGGGGGGGCLVSRPQAVRSIVFQADRRMSHGVLFVEGQSRSGRQEYTPGLTPLQPAAGVIGWGVRLRPSCGVGCRVSSPPGVAAREVATTLRAQFGAGDFSQETRP